MRVLGMGSLALVLGLSVACKSATGAAEPEGQPVAVHVATAEMSSIPTRFEAGGVVRAKATAIIASRVLAPIVGVHANAGDRVHRDAPLITLDAREMVAARTRAVAASTSAAEASRAAEADERAAESALVLARTTRERVNTLYEKRSATAQEFDQAVAALAAAEAQANAARARVSAARAASDAAQAAADSAQIGATYATIPAPFDGIVTERRADVGSMAVPGTPLMVIEDAAAYRLEAQLDEARAASIVVGQPADVRFDHAEDRDAWTAARVVEVGRVEPASHSFLIKIELPPSMHPTSGLFGRARFAGAERRSLLVPASALVNRGQLTFVFVVEDGRARLRPISAGARDGDRVEVLAGVREKDAVVTDPPPALSDGARVTGAGR